MRRPTMAGAIAGSRRERNGRVFLMLAGLFALIFAVLAFVVLNSGDGGGKAGVGDVKVVVAADNLPAGTRLTGDNLKVISVASSLQVEGAYSAISPLVGLVNRYPIAAGEQITLAKIGAQASQRDGRSFIIPPGKRAMAVSVNQVSAVGGLLLPGDRVDVIAVTTEVDGLGQRVTAMFQNIEVLAGAQAAAESVPPPLPDATEAGQEGQGVSGPSPGRRPGGARPQPNPR